MPTDDADGDEDSDDAGSKNESEADAVELARIELRSMHDDMVHGNTKDNTLEVTPSWSTFFVFLFSTCVSGLTCETMFGLCVYM